MDGPHIWNPVFWKDHGLHTILIIINKQVQNLFHGLRISNNHCDLLGKTRIQGILPSGMEMGSDHAFWNAAEEDTRIPDSLGKVQEWEPRDLLACMNF